MSNWNRRPSPAMIVALTALFVALGGTASAVGIVPLAQRAKVADNAQQLQGKSAAALLTQAARAPASPASHVAIAALPSPASTAAGLISTKTASWSLIPGGYNVFTVMCDSGQKALSGGYDDAGGWAHTWDTKPTPDGRGWATFVMLDRDAPSPQSGLIYTLCVK